MKNFLLLLCFGVPLIQANEESVGNANAYVDEVLTNFQHEDSILVKIDPLTIPDVKEKNFELHQGHITGLANLYRHGDCTLAFDGYNNTVSVIVEMGVRDVEVKLQYGAHALFFWIRGNATVSVEDVAIRMELSGRKGRAKLESFKVMALGKYQIKRITGLSKALNWLYKLIANAVAKNSRKKIINALENGAASAISDLLDKNRLPNLTA